MTSPRPSATGALATTPVLNLLAYGLDRRLSGTLVVESPHGSKAALLFKAGVPCKASAGAGVHLLGELLIESAGVDPSAIASALAKGDERLGQLLLRMEVIDGDTLTSALHEQLLRRISVMATLPDEAIYGYYDQADFLGGHAEIGGIDPLNLIWRLAELGVADARVPQYVERLAARELKLHPRAKPTRFGFPRRALPVIDVLRAKPQLFERLLAAELAETQTLMRMLYVMALTRHLDLGREGVEPIGVESAVSLRPAWIAAQGSIPPFDSAQPRASTTPFPSMGPPALNDPLDSQVSPPGSVSDRPRAADGVQPVAAAASGKPPIARDSVQPVAPASRRPSASESMSPAPAFSSVTPGTGDSGRPSASTSTAAFKASLTPQPISERPAKPLRAELRDLLDRIDSLNYYEMLGVAEDANLLAIQSAFFQLAKKWHPDKLPQNLVDLRDEATRVFAKLNEAHQVLANNEQRGEYDRRRAKASAEGLEQETVQQVLRAATAFQKAEILARKHDFSGAARLAEEAFNGDPEQVEYGAFYAYAAAHTLDKAEKNYAPLLAMLETAVRSEEDNVRIHYYRGVVLKRAGKLEDAIREFRFVADKDPNNVEAVREVRLHKMRSEAKAEAKAETKNSVKTEPGLLSRFFKR